MKKIITALAVTLVSLVASATEYEMQRPNQGTTVKSTSSAEQSTTATGTASNQGNAQSITFTSPPETTTTLNYGTDQVIKNTPSVSGPSLTTSNDTCMGSTSGSINIAGLGIGGGSTWTDANCKMLKNSRELWNMGMKAASMALMCNDALNKEALELTGYICPQSRKNETNAKVESKAELKSDAQYAGNDPIVRLRFGMTTVEAK